MGAERTDEIGRCPGRPSCGQHIVDNEDVVLGDCRIAVYLDTVGAVLEVIDLVVNIVWELAGLSDRHKTSTES